MNELEASLYISKSVLAPNVALSLSPKAMSLPLVVLPRASVCASVSLPAVPVIVKLGYVPDTVVVPAPVNDTV